MSYVAADTLWLFCVKVVPAFSTKKGQNVVFSKKLSVKN